MDNLRTWLENNKPLLRSRWLKGLSKTVSALQEYDWPDLFDLLERGIGTDGQVPSDVIDALRTWFVAKPTTQRVSMSDWLAAILLLRSTLTDLFQQSIASSSAAEWFAQVNAYLDCVTIQAAEIFAETVDQIVQDRLAEAKFLEERTLRAAEEADQVLLKLRAMHQISLNLSPSLELKALLKVVVEQLVQNTPAEACAIWLKKAGLLQDVAHYGFEDETWPVWHKSLTTPGDEGLVHHAFEQSSSGRLAGDAPLLNHLGARAIYTWPLCTDTETLGVLLLASFSTTHPFDSTDLAPIDSVTQPVATAIQNARTFEKARKLNWELARRIDQSTEAMQRERDQLEALYTLTRRISTSLDVDQVMERTLNIISAAVGVSHGSIMLMDQEKGVLVMRAILSSEKPLSPEGEPTPFKSGVGLAGWVYENRQAILVDDVTNDPRWVESGSRGSQTRSLIIAPLAVDLENYGVMTVSDERPGFFTEEHLRLVSTAAGQVARAINNAQLYSYLSQTAQELGETLRREQQEAFKSQAILQSIADGVVVTDIRGRIILINAATERILRTHRQAMMGQDVRNVFAAFESGGREEMLKAMEELAANPTAEQKTLRIIQSTLAMEQTTVSAHLAPVFTSNGEFIGIVSVFRDITREVQADIAKTEFVSTVSHELRTPLTSIKGYTDLLMAEAMGCLTEGQKQFMGIIRNNADRLTALINDLLDISRIESGRVKLDLQPVQIEEVVQDVVQSLRNQIEAKGLTLRVQVSEFLPPVHGDRDRLTQVLTNLLSNAYRYTPQGEVAIVVSQMPGVLRVDVSDTGIGITPEDQGKIWDRFFRANHPVVEGAGGTGLGLSIVRMFIEMHGGRIWVESEPNKGSTFTFILPTLEGEKAQVLQPEPEIKLLADADRKTVLVVDDEPDILGLIRHQLESQGYRVITAGLGEEALAKANAEHPDLITLDILLPDRDGFDVLCELKANPSTADIPVLILSIVQDEESGLRLGAMDYLTKPIDEQRLIASVRAILDRKARVLIAEDDPDTADMIAQMLERYSYQSLIAVDGYETLALARREKPGLILLDLRMPGMDGYEALVRLKQDVETCDIPIIAMSAHATDYRTEREKLLALGAAEFLSKPFTVERLVAELERVMGENGE